MKVFSTTIVNTVSLTPDDLHINQISFKKQKHLTNSYNKTN